MEGFRRYWLAQFLSALGNGSLRFVFVWLVLDLSNADSAAGLVGMALGLPALLVTLPAGAASDRLDRRRLIVVGQAAAAVVLGLAAAAVWTDVTSVPVAAVFAALLGGILASVGPGPCGRSTRRSWPPASWASSPPSPSGCASPCAPRSAVAGGGGRHGMVGRGGG